MKENNYLSLQLDLFTYTKFLLSIWKVIDSPISFVFLFSPKVLYERRRRKERKGKKVSLFMWTKHYLRASKIMFGFLLCFIFSYNWNGERRGGEGVYTLTSHKNFLSNCWCPPLIWTIWKHFSIFITIGKRMPRTHHVKSVISSYSSYIKQQSNKICRLSTCDCLCEATPWQKKSCSGASHGWHLITALGFDNEWKILGWMS